MRANLVAALLIAGCASTGEPRPDRADAREERAGTSALKPVHPSIPLEPSGAGEIARAWAYDRGELTQVRSIERQGGQFVVELDVVQPKPGRMTVAVDAGTGAVTPRDQRD